MSDPLPTVPTAEGIAWLRELEAAVVKAEQLAIHVGSLRSVNDLDDAKYRYRLAVMNNAPALLESAHLARLAAKFLEEHGAECWGSLSLQDGPEQEAAFEAFEKLLEGFGLDTNGEPEGQQGSLRVCPKCRGLPAGRAQECTTCSGTGSVDYVATKPCPALSGGDRISDPEHPANCRVCRNTGRVLKDLANR